MNYSRLTIIMAALAVAAPLTQLRADEATDPGMKSAHQWDASKMQKKFGLNDEQVTQLKALRDAQKLAVKPLRDKQHELMQTLSVQLQKKAPDSEIQVTLGSLKTNQQAIRGQMEQFRTQKETILTPTQQAEMLLARMKHMGKKHHFGSKSAGGDDEGAVL